VIVCRDLEEVRDYCPPGECFVIGGARIFSQFLPLASKLVLTLIDAAYQGDAYFPEFDAASWELTYFEEIATASGVRISFIEYVLKTREE
jgi:dihydrofolate reductase